jgi:hypothetical protein
MKTYELKRKKGLKSSVYAIALVENPAIEVGFVALSKDGKVHTVKLAVNSEKRMIYTPVLIPNQKIYREDEQGNPYQIFFSEQTIEETAQDFIKAGSLVANWNSEHQENVKLEGVTVVESWIIDDPKSDKALSLGFDLPKGTWMQGVKIDNESIWNEVKLGTYKGISIEGLFENFETNLSKSIKPNIMSEKKFSLGDVITKLMGTENAPEVKLEDAAEMPKEEVKAAMIEDGEYVLADGRKIVVAGDMITEVMESEVESVEEMEEEKDKAIAQLSKEIEEVLSQMVTKMKAIEDKVNTLDNTSAPSITKLSTEPSVTSAFEKLRNKAPQIN